MTKHKMLIAGLTLSLGMLAFLASPKSVSALLTCGMLKTCAPAGGCLTQGSVSGCTITCSDGSNVACGIAP